MGKEWMWKGVDIGREGRVKFPKYFHHINPTFIYCDYLSW